MNKSQIKRVLAMIPVATLSITMLTGCSSAFSSIFDTLGISPEPDIKVNTTAAIDDTELIIDTDKNNIVILDEKEDSQSGEVVDTADEIVTADEGALEVEETTEVIDNNSNTETSIELTDFEKNYDVDASKYKGVSRSRGDVSCISYFSSYLYTDREAYVYTPPEYDTDIEYPVVYVLHGLGCDGEQWISMGAARMLDNLINAGMIEPVVAVFPSIVPKNGLTEEWLSDENIAAFTNFTTELNRDLRPYINYYYSVSKDRDKTAICGLSMGGMEALRSGFTYIDQFDYIGSFSAAPTLDTDLLKVGEGVASPKLVLLCSGDADEVVEDNPKTYHETLDKNGVEHLWYEHPGGGHTSHVWEVGFVNFITRAFGTEDVEE